MFKYSFNYNFSIGVQSTPLTSTHLKGVQENERFFLFDFFDYTRT